MLEACVIASNHHSASPGYMHFARSAMIDCMNRRLGIMAYNCSQVGQLNFLYDFTAV